MAESQTKEPRGENWVTTAIWIIVGILLFGGIIAGIVLGAQACAHQSQSNVALPPCETGIVCVNAHTVGHDYAENELAADQKYKDNTVRISGRIWEIGRDDLGRAFIDLNSGYINYMVRCYFDAADEHLIIGFQYNDKIWIQGTGAGFVVEPDTKFERAVFIHCDMAQFLEPETT